MLILLPPSEGKTIPTSGPRLDLTALSHPILTTTRKDLVAHLVRLCRDDPRGAAAALGLGPRQSDDVAGNAALRSRPCAPAIDIYSGVLYDSLGFASLTAAQRRRAADRLLIGSALWGLIRPDDVIPPYRLSGGTTLPGLGSMRRVWSEPLGHALTAIGGPVLDLRSGAYRDLAPVPRRDDWISIRVFEERNGRRTVVSHNNKSTKGTIARAVLASRRDLPDARRLARALGTWGYRVESEASAATTLDVIVG